MASRTNSQNVLVVDVGGTSVKSLPPGRIRLRKFPPGPKLKPKPMLFEVNQIARDWKYDVVSIGYPGLVLRGRPALELHNLGSAWVGLISSLHSGAP